MTASHTNQQWFSPEELAGLLRIPLQDVLGAIHRGEIRSINIGGHVRVDLHGLYGTTIEPYSGEPVAGLGEAVEHISELNKRRLSTQHAVSSSAGVIPIPRGLTWLEELSMQQTGFEATWPTRRGEELNVEEYPKFWRGKIRVNAELMEVAVGQGERYSKPRMTVWLNNYPSAEFIGTHPSVAENGWVSLIKPDGSRVLSVGMKVPALYENCRVMLYREARGGGGSGVPRHGLGVIVASGKPEVDLQSAVYHGVARRLAKQGIEIGPS